MNGSLLEALQIKGFVTNGRVRDVNELRTFSYPVFARGLCVARSYMRLVEVGTPVTVGGMTVEPGDIIHGDEHGVLNIPADALPAIFDKAELIRADEQNVVGWSRSDEFTLEGLLALEAREALRSVEQCERRAVMGARSMQSTPPSLMPRQIPPSPRGSQLRPHVKRRFCHCGGRHGTGWQGFPRRSHMSPTSQPAGSTCWFAKATIPGP